MRRFFSWLLLSCVALGVARAQAQPAPLMVEAGHSSFIASPGITAAYSLDPDIVAVEAVVGGIRISGKMPGSGTIMLVGITGAHPVPVTVSAPLHASAYSGLSAAVTGQTVEFGEYDVRYNNNPSQFSGLETVTQIAGDRQINVRVMNDDVAPGQGQTPVEFPMASYEIARRGNSVTLIDETVDNSDLTINETQVRGVHVVEGPWRFHAGVTSDTEYQNFLLPAQRVEIAGLSRTFRLNDRSALDGNLYYFQAGSGGVSNVTPGAIGTARYSYNAGRKLSAWVEAGVGHGYALAGKADRDTGTEQMHAYFHYQSPLIAALSLDELHGRQAEFSWTKKISRRWTGSLMGDDTDIDLATQKDLADTGTLSPSYWVNSHLGIISGLTASRFLSIDPSSPGVRSFGYLAGPQFTWHYFGGSFQYQQLRNTGNTPDSKNYAIAAQTNVFHLMASAFYDHNSEAPVFAPIQSPGQPDLQQLLFRESQATWTPEQMAQFIRQTAPLASQGYMQPVAIVLAAERDQYGTTITSNSDKLGRLTFQGMLNTNSGGNSPSLRLLTGGVTWTHKFGVTNLLNAGFSMYKTETAGTELMQPILQFGWQHKLNTAPRWLLPGRRGIISGHIFVDNNYTQLYRKGDPPLSGVLVYLDGRRTTHTDSDGSYTFHGVPWGTHSVEAAYKDGHAFYYTSSSPKAIPTNGVADFGISFAKGRIFGKFTDDAGNGLQVTLSVQGPGLQREVNTDGFGNIEIDGLPNGSYTVHPEPSSIPPGYSLADLSDMTVSVTAQTAGKFHLQVPAQRSLAGAVLVFDPTTGKTTPLGGVTVTLGAGGAATYSMETDDEGRYLFRHLPAGSWTLAVVHDGKIWTRSTTLTAAPDIESGIDVTITEASPEPSLPAPALEPPPSPSPNRNSGRKRARRRLESVKRKTVTSSVEPASTASNKP